MSAPRKFICLETKSILRQWKGSFFWVDATFVAWSFRTRVPALTRSRGEGIWIYGRHARFVSLPKRTISMHNIQRIYVNADFCRMLCLNLFYYSGRSVSGTVPGLTTAKFKPLMHPIPSFFLLTFTYVWIYVILGGICLFLELFWYVIAHVRNFALTALFPSNLPVARITRFCRRYRFKEWASTAYWRQWIIV
jgi:hypothetical protein